jgi:hypothetical protein
VTAVADVLCSEYLRGMGADRAAVLLLTGCTLRAGNPGPVEDLRPAEDTGPWVPPALQVRPDAIDFGAIEVGDRVSTSIELENIGGDDLVLDELELAHEDPTIQLEWAAGDTLAAGASAQLSLTWSPHDVAILENKLWILSNDPDTPFFAVQLTGATATPQIQVDPISVDFGVVTIGRDTVRHVSILNAGYADLEIESVSFMASDSDDLQYFPGPDPGDPTSAWAFPLTIPPGESRDVTITYAPLDDTADQSVLTVNSNDPVTPQVRAEQEGTGVAQEDTGT